MADEKLNTGPAENISPEAAEPIITPEQAAASEPQQEQTGPAIPESGDVVVSFDKINELMAEKRQNARAEVEKAETPETPEAAAPGETPPYRKVRTDAPGVFKRSPPSQIEHLDLDRGVMDIPCRPERTGTGTVRHYHGADESHRGRDRGIEANSTNGMGAAL